MSWTKESLIIPKLTARTNFEAIEILARLLYERGYVLETFVEAVLERERVFATGLPTPEIQVAIPHADIEHVIHQAIAVGVLDEPVEFREMGNPDRTVNVRIICMLAVKKSETLVSLLQNLMGIFQNAEILHSIIEATDAAQIAAIFNNRLPLNQES